MNATSAAAGAGRSAFGPLLGGANHDVPISSLIFVGDGFLRNSRLAAVGFNSFLEALW